jgi:hypothetical protein
MNWNKLRLVGAASIDLPIFGADPEGPFILKGVDGLGPPERDVKIARTVQEGGYRQGTRTQNRQVVHRVGLQPDWDTGQTSADLRNMMYGLLTPPANQSVKLQVMLGSTILAQTEGDISTFETALFSKDPEVQITLDCDYPYLRKPAITYQIPAKSLVSGKTAVDISNDGTAPAGFWMKIVLQSNHSGSLVISDDTAGGEVLELNGPWNAGDILTVDTRAGQRGVWRQPAGAGSGGNVSILGRMTGVSRWLQLHGLANRLLINNTAFDFSGNGFGHTVAYWGV